ncbi:MAG: hypothetical protein ABSG67_15365 [Thermoguttaceae bacterium]
MLLKSIYDIGGQRSSSSLNFTHFTTSSARERTVRVPPRIRRHCTLEYLRLPDADKKTDPCPEGKGSEVDNLKNMFQDKGNAIVFY